MEKGYTHIYTGEGKGKTTAAAGLAVRALGQGLKVGFFQFLKSGFTGEMTPIVKMGGTFLAPQGSGKFVWQMDEAEKEACQKQQQATLARAAAMQAQFDVLVLDEVVCAVQAGMLNEGEVLRFTREKPQGLELVLTGRGASAALTDAADYVTEMREVKHPYKNGVPARPGIEF